MLPAVHSKQFNITAANVVACDTAAVSLYTLPDTTNKIWVPRLLKLRYDAGDVAFSITPLAKSYTARDRGKHDPKGLKRVQRPHVTDYLDDDFLIFSFTKTADNDGSARVDDPVFVVSMRDLGLLETTDKAVIALPISNGAVYTTDKTAFVVRGSGGTYTGGTSTGTRKTPQNGVIECELFFDEYQVGR